ncbi:MAG: YCF48-related protein [bacterium]|nr:YCF48-related protein [bacterium]
MRKIYIAGVLIFVCINCISAQNQWYKQNSGVTSNFSDMSFVDTLNGWVIGGWPAYHTSDGGRHWGAQVPVDSPYCGGNCIGFKDSLEGWAGGSMVYSEGTLLYHTTDEGNHWGSAKKEKMQLYSIHDINIYNSTCGVAIGYRWGSGVGSDYDSWILPLFGIHGQTKHFDDGSDGYKTCFLDSLHGWYAEVHISSVIISDDTFLLYYTNMGLDSLKVIDSSFYANDFDFSDTLNGWAVKNSGVILHSEDGGKVWNTQTSGVNDTLACVDFIDSLNGWIVGTGGCILRTRDGGNHWDAESSPTIENLRKVQFIDSSHGWAVGDNGTILYYGPFQGIEEKLNIKNQKLNIEAKPNPFVQSTVVSYSASGGFRSAQQEKDKEIKIQVYDISGKLVEETKSNIITAKAGCSIGKNLKPGIYFVKVNDYKPLKIVKMKKIAK